MQLQVHQHLVHLRVADALADAESAGMNAIRACDNRGEGLAIAMPRSQWPCQSTRIFSPEGFTTSFEDKTHQVRRRPSEWRVRRVADHDGARACS